jgi:RimJ/RimL family protein N-acetyltransferase
MNELWVHDVTLRDGPLVLRPLTEEDWPLLAFWLNDPEVAYYAAFSPLTGITLPEIQRHYRSVSQEAFVFVIEVAKRPIGYAWLQQMKLERILLRLPELEVRRLDIFIGEKSFWGKGWGSTAIALLTEFAFERLGADAVLGCDIGEHNPRSRAAFEKNGYDLFIETVQPTGGGLPVIRYDMILRREKHEKARPPGPETA